MAGAKGAGAEVRERCVCGGWLQAFEGTLAFTLREVAALTWRVLSRGLT